MEHLKVKNSLRVGDADTVVPFVPMEPGKISWYACGPTVYDKSHLGHARNYVSTDIIRRILIHYFGYKVNFVMNMTDVDDKIIVKARQQRLLEHCRQQARSPEEMYQLGLDAFRHYARKYVRPIDTGIGDLDETNYADRKKRSYGKVLHGKKLRGNGQPGEEEAKIKMHLENLDAACSALQSANVFPGINEVLKPYLDSTSDNTLNTEDHSIFTDLTQHMEDLFMQDMDRLNVLRPDHITRVTQYMPKIVDFVKRLVDKGFAYQAQGSVYFDIAAFQDAGNTYARLRPESKNDKSLQDEGEGSLSHSLTGKRNPGDFALWKKSKDGEPFWPSPWGNGRPGWHIECSVMASDILGSRMDIHSGGIDLAFPHHDNELAQSEAYFCESGKGEHTWVNYFLHMGHLTISGSKMSKSLKNFQTIQDALDTAYTPRGLRIIFLMGKWNDRVEISPAMKEQADSWENTITSFMRTVKAKLADADLAHGVESLSVGQQGNSSTDMLAELQEAKKDVETALCNSFDTPQVMRILLKLVSSANVYMADNGNLAALETVARWITKMVGILGLDVNAKPPYENLGWDSTIAQDADPARVVIPYIEALRKVQSEVRQLYLHDEETSALLAQTGQEEFESVMATGTRDLEKLALPYVRIMSRIRDRLRLLPSSELLDVQRDILPLTDRIRDHDLVNVGVQLVDQADKSPHALALFAPAEELIAARNEKAAREAKNAELKEAARLEAARIASERNSQRSIHPKDMFLKDDKFSAFDQRGLPTQIRSGNQVSKSQQKYHLKNWLKQKQRYSDWLKEKYGLDSHQYQAFDEWLRETEAEGEGE
ncbi:hypothetical protein CDD82_4918 [Ophiocordyceps australis]|uniref:cysteine--tRNA ligase n=1 Tax=Ophiocordyceps australis TaxID=1399860 RepID=A0A2C5Z443_9HYPO|nr:hypothetical protein CDD82_4918 [Ophiocordyceps australis]